MSEVSRICADHDEQAASFADRDLSEQPFPYVFLDTTYKARVEWWPRRSWSPSVVFTLLHGVREESA